MGADFLLVLSSWEVGHVTAGSRILCHASGARREVGSGRIPVLAHARTHDAHDVELSVLLLRRAPNALVCRSNGCSRKHLRYFIAFLFGGVSCHDSRATPLAEVARRTSASGVYHHGPRRRRRQPAAVPSLSLLVPLSFGDSHGVGKCRPLRHMGHHVHAKLFDDGSHRGSPCLLLRLARRPPLPCAPNRSQRNPRRAPSLGLLAVPEGMPST